MSATVRNNETAAPKVWPFDQINEAINGVTSGDGGFTSYLVAL